MDTERGVYSLASDDLVLEQAERRETPWQWVCGWFWIIVMLLAGNDD